MNEEMKAVIEQAIRQYGGEEITEAQHKGWIMEIDLMLYRTRIRQSQALIEYYRDRTTFYRAQLTKGSELTAAERDILEHALKGGGKRVYRNHYAAEEGSEVYDILMGMKLRGLVKTGHSPAKGLLMFYVTDAGAEAVGLELPRET